MNDKIIRKYEPEEAAAERLKYIHKAIVPPVESVFADYPKLKSAVLMVSQFWCDEAFDAVHGHIVYSLSHEPDLDRHRREIDRLASVDDGFDADDYESLDNEQYAYAHFIEGPKTVAALGEAASEITKWDGQEIYKHWRNWDSNDDAIPLFAAYCTEGGHQGGGKLEFSSPCAILRRGENNIVEIDILGDMARPWMDGVQPEGESLAKTSNKHLQPTGVSTTRKSFWARLLGRK